MDRRRGAKGPVRSTYLRYRSLNAPGITAHQAATDDRRGTPQHISGAGEPDRLRCQKYKCGRFHSGRLKAENKPQCSSRNREVGEWHQELSRATISSWPTHCDRKSWFRKHSPCFRPTNCTSGGTPSRARHVPRPLNLTVMETSAEFTDAGGAWKISASARPTTPCGNNAR